MTSISNRKAFKILLLLVIFTSVVTFSIAFAAISSSAKDDDKTAKNPETSSNLPAPVDNNAKNALPLQNKKLPNAETSVDISANGDLDGNFGANGKVTTSIRGTSDFGNGVAIQPDGKIIVVGQSQNGTDNDFALARYNVNGTLDNTFGNAGKVATKIGSFDDYAFAVALQTDNKIVVAGFSSNGANTDFALARYNANGSLDTTFDADGKLTTAFGAANDEAYGVAIQNDGKISRSDTAA